MKKIFLFLSAVFLVSAGSATIGTYSGELEKQGPETELLIGYASDQPATIELDVSQRNGLNLSYNKSFDFRPENISRVVQRRGKQLSLKEFNIEVVSDKPKRQIYEIPVTLTAFNQGTEQEGVTPRIIQEREYVFEYRTELSPEYGYQGDLIDTEKENETSERPDETLNVSDENSLTDQSQEDTQGEEEEPDPGLNPILVVLVVAVFGYVIYEVFT